MHFWRFLTILKDFEGKWPFFASPNVRNPQICQEMLFACRCDIKTNNLGQKHRKWVKNIEKSLILMIFDHFDPSLGCAKGRDPLGRPKLKIFYKNHQNRSPGVYFIELYRFTKPLTSLDLQFYRCICWGRIKRTAK